MKISMFFSCQLSPVETCLPCGTFDVNLGNMKTTTFEGRLLAPVAFFLRCSAAVTHSALGSNIGVGRFRELDDGNNLLSAFDSDSLILIRLPDPVAICCANRWTCTCESTMDIMRNRFHHLGSQLIWVKNMAV